MACETCDHTMQRVNDGEPPVFWCPRCGTLKSEGGAPEFEEPMVVDRATKLCQAASDGPVYDDSLLATVAESVGLHL